MYFVQLSFIYHLSHNAASWEIKQCNKIDKPLVDYRSKDFITLC